eukprot:14526868-Alexandrium_andersonii.AAC.1
MVSWAARAVLRRPPCAIAGAATALAGRCSAWASRAVDGRVPWNAREFPARVVWGNLLRAPQCPSSTRRLRPPPPGSSH